MFDLTGWLNWIGNKSYNVAIAKTTTPKIGNSIHSKNFFISLEIYGTTLHWYCCHVWICAPNCYLDLINNINYYVVCCSCTCSLRQKCPNAELFLVRIFLYSDWIRRFTPNSVRIRKIRTRNNSVFGHFSRSGWRQYFDIYYLFPHWQRNFGSVQYGEYFCSYQWNIPLVSIGKVERARCNRCHWRYWTLCFVQKGRLHKEISKTTRRIKQYFDQMQRIKANTH